jgi:hypothetical protein
VGASTNKSHEARAGALNQNVSDPTAFPLNSLAKTASAQGHALELLGGAFPLEAALASLINLIEMQCQGSLVAAITLVDAPHSRLRACSGASLPRWFLEAIADT